MFHTPQHMKFAAFEEMKRSFVCRNCSKHSTKLWSGVWHAGDSIKHLLRGKAENRAHNLKF